MIDIKSLMELPPWEWPEETGRGLLEIITGEEGGEEDRLTAVELSGETVVIDNEIAQALLNIVSDPNEPEELRGRAAISLGPVLEEMDLYLDEDDDLEEELISEELFQQIVESLRVLFNDPEVPPLVRRRVLEAAVRAPRDWHEKAVRDAYKSDEADWKLTGVFCMQYIKGFEKEILESLKDSDAAVRLEAVIGTGNWELEEAWPEIKAIITGVKDDEELLLAAIEASPFVNPVEAVNVLSKIKDTDDEFFNEVVHEAISIAKSMMNEFDEEDY